MIVAFLRSLFNKSKYLFIKDPPSLRIQSSFLFFYQMSVKPKDLELTPGRFVGEGHPTFIIAEIGQNHQGSVSCFNVMKYLFEYTVLIILLKQSITHSSTYLDVE